MIDKQGQRGNAERVPSSPEEGGFIDAKGRAPRLPSCPVNLRTEQEIEKEIENTRQFGGNPVVGEHKGHPIFWHHVATSLLLDGPRAERPSPITDFTTKEAMRVLQRYSDVLDNRERAQRAPLPEALPASLGGVQVNYRDMLRSGIPVSDVTSILSGEHYERVQCRTSGETPITLEKLLANARTAMKYTAHGVFPSTFIRDGSASVAKFILAELERATVETGSPEN